MNKISKENFQQDSYKYGFVTEIESERIPKGLNEEIVRIISQKKNEPQWMLDWRLKAFHRLESMKKPDWAKVKFDEIDFQDIYYYSSPKGFQDKPKSLDEVDPKLLFFKRNTKFFISF
jgi:Fe-S cluster assembly protein SufB